MADLNLTFGVELEFICVYPEAAFTNRFPDLVSSGDDEDLISAGHAITYHLQQSGVPTTGWDELGVDIGAPSYSRWIVDTDVLFLSPDENLEVPNGYFEESVEISSRIFHLAGQEWSDELERVLAVLHMMRQRYGCIFITNKTTGFHVHVGNNGGLQMPFRTSQKVFQLLTAHERAFDALHAANRVTAPEDPQADPDNDPPMPNFAPLSFFHNCNSRGQVANPFDWLRTIERTLSFTGFGQIFNVRQSSTYLNGHNAVVNFDNNFIGPGQYRYAEDLKNTIEFRQHAGTLDILEIRAYVSLLCSVVQYCHVSNDTEFLHLLVQAAHPNFTSKDLLSSIGVHPEVLAHYTRYENGKKDRAPLGILPFPQVQNIPLVATDLDPLTRLSAQNDLEQTENAEQSRVTDKIQGKYTSLYYGWDPAAGALPLSHSEITWMLEQAFEQSGSTNGAWDLVLGKLSDIYNDLDNSLPAWPVILRHLQEWR